MDAEIARLAVAEFARVAPAARVNAGVIVAPGGRTDISLPIQVRGRRRRCGKTPAATVITVDIHVSDLAEFAAFDVAIARFETVWGAAPFQTNLDRAFIFSRGGNHGLSCDHVVADRLLHVAVRSCL